MNNYSFHPIVVLRTPAFSYQEQNNYTLQEQVSNPYFQQALSLSTPSLSGALAQSGFQVTALKPKAILSLQNYLNRMHFRSVPFGLFSSFSVAQWQDPESALHSMQLDPGLLHVLLEFETQYREAQQTVRQADGQLLYFKNPSLYKAGNTYRYIHPVILPAQKQVSFRLAAIGHPALIRLLPAHKKLTLSDFHTLLLQQTQLTSTQADLYLQELVACGVLLPHLPVQQLGFKQDLEQYPLGNKSGSTQVVPELPDVGPVYSNLERTVKQGALPRHYQDSIQQGMAALQRLVLPAPLPAALSKFRREFEHKFEGRLIPLMVAMDPELGVGYGNLDAAEASDIVSALSLSSLPNPSKLRWTAVHALLLDKMQEATLSPHSGIILTDEDMARLPAPADQLPPSIPVLFRPLGEEVYIEAAGGATATALPGRFSLYQQALQQALGEYAHREMKHNPAVVFAEIESVQDLHVANVERRPALYAYTIPLLTDCGSRAGTQLIPLSDLWVAIRGGSVLLWSKKLRKQVIPRLSTAYNYHHSPLGVFRFLCDLQHQHIRTHFHFRMHQYFPGMSFYPRVSYGPSIISLATWYLRKEDWESLAAPRGGAPLPLREWLAAKGCPRYVALTDGDHQLVYDLEDPEALGQLWKNLKGKKRVCLQEFPFPQCEALAMDAEGKPLMTQILATMMHDREVFPDRTAGFANLAPLHDSPYRTHPHWLYVKIYVRPEHADQLLLQYIMPFIRDLKAARHIRKWFFIRYHDTRGFHIRLRLFRNKEVATSTIWAAMDQMLYPLLQQGFLSGVQADTYQRELERYLPAAISEVETLFCADSDWVLALLQESSVQAQDRLTQAFISTRLLVDTLLPQSLKVAHCQTAFEALMQEHRGNKTTRRSLMTAYNRQIKHLLRPTTEAEVIGHPGWSRIQETALRIRSKIKDNATLSQLSGHLIHMHLNRCLAHQPRVQEMVIYYFLLRYYQEQYHKQT